jgi:Fe-S oxidoreductase
MSKLRKIKAIANLSKHFWLHVIRNAVHRPKPGEELAKFREYYRADHLVPLSGEERGTLLEYQKCINCGTCARVCPVYGPAAHGFYRAPDSIAASLSRSFPEFDSARDAVYNCTQCGACAAACPRGIDVPALVMMVRKKAVQAHQDPIFEQYKIQINNLSTAGTVHGKSEVNLSKFKKSTAEYVFFAGCTDRAIAPEETLISLELLKHVGVDFTVIDDSCCGGFHRSAGMIHEFLPQIQQNIEKILACGTNKVIFSCPHGLYTMRTHPMYHEKLESFHITQVLNALEFEIEPSSEIVTFHDPCFLGRKCGIYSQPRELIARTGAEFREISQNQDLSVCCGSREGEFTLDEKTASDMAKSRIQQAERTKAGILLTACNACRSSLFSASKSDISIMSISEFLFERIMKKTSS